MKNRFNICLKGLLLIVTILFYYSCDKRDIPPTYSKANFTISLKSGSSAIIWDSIHCINAAGNKYSVATANFYISNITLKAENGVNYNSKAVYYIDPRLSSKSTFSLDSIPPNEYYEMSFLVGIEASKNVSYSLPSTSDNINMIWPTAMGGGYHFMKLEGHYLDTVSVKKGYAIHMGKNDNLITAKINFWMHQKYWDHRYNLIFDLNEVFANPYTYNLNFDPNYTMSDSVAMFRIKNNMTDAFSLIQNN